MLEPMKGASQINSFSFALSAKYEKFFKRSIGPFQVIRDLWHPYMALWAAEIPRLYRSYIRRLTRHVKLRAPHGCDHGPRDSGFHSSAGKIILETNFKDNSSRKRFLVTPSS